MRRFFGKYLIPILVVLVVVAAILVVLQLTVSTPKTDNTTTYAVQRGDISATVRATGRLEASRQVRLAFRAGDAIKKLYIKPGDIVPSGTLLAEADTTSLERNLQQVEGQREISRFNLSAAAERAAASPTPAAATAPATPQTVSDLYALAKQAELADLQLEAARQALEGAKLYAPFDGTVLAVSASEGEYPNGASIITFADLSLLQVRADIDELDVPNVDVGQKVSMTLDAFPGRTFDGRVASLSPAGNLAQGSTTYAAIILFDKKPEVKVRPGMAASLTITSLTKAGVLVVPSRAVETIGLKQYVTLITNGNRNRVPVTVGLTNGDTTEIVSGLSPGDIISVPR